MPQAASKNSARVWKYPALQTKSVLLEYFREHLGGEKKNKKGKDILLRCLSYMFLFAHKSIFHLVTF